MAKNIFFGIFFTFIVIIFGTFGFNVYSQIYTYPSNSPKGNYSITVEPKDDLESIAQKLYNDKVIVSVQGLLWQEKLSPISKLHIGLYSLELPAKPENILSQLDNQTNQKKIENSKLLETRTEKITFIEGETADQVISKLDKSGVATREELENFIKNPANFSSVKYPFLPTPLLCEYGNMKTCAKYYLEGYLYPDTYIFIKPTKPKDIFDKFLINFNNRVWQKVKDKTTEKELYNIVTMASVIEKETGRTKGVTQSNMEEVTTERKKIAGVFFNRINSQMQWQSNPTVEYGTGNKLCESTFSREGCKFLNDKSFQTKYNTYINNGYPVGPITSPQFDNIDAVLNPLSSNFLFFVADATGKTYFGKNQLEHDKNITIVNKINRDLGIN